MLKYGALQTHNASYLFIFLQKNTFLPPEKLFFLNGILNFANHTHRKTPVF